MNRILIVIDMQNDFITGTLGSAEAEAVVENVVRKIQKYNREGERILCTLDTHYQNYRDTQEGRKLPVPHCIKPENGWELNERIKEELAKNAGKIRYFEKNTFGSWELAEYLKQTADARTEFEFIGVCTDICVVSNVLLVKAAFPENKIIVDASCCAGVTKETHRYALETMKMCQIDIIGEIDGGKSE